MKTLLTKQQNFFLSQATKDYHFRIRQLEALEKALKFYEEDFKIALFQDFKKSNFESYITELALSYKEISIAKQHLRSWMRPQRVSTNLINFPSKSFMMQEPMGSVLIIGPWNYPVLLLLSPLIAAIAAGNTVILKPSELTEHTASIMHKMILEYFPKEYIAVVEGGVEVTSQLLKLKFDKIFFTGSTRVGKIVYQAAAKNLVPVTLELGGKSPAIVTASAHINMTAKRLIWGKFLNAGQTCIAPDFVMVHESVEKAFLIACKNEIQKTGYSIDRQNYCQIINDRHFQRLAKLIDPAKVYTGGTLNPEERIIDPTILQGVDFEDPIMEEEIFGPLLPVLTFKDYHLTLARLAQMPKPLSAYLFSTTEQEQQSFLNTFSFGGGAINDVVMHITNPELPFGGVGLSGMGKYHGISGFLTFSHQKSILKKSNWLELPLKYTPRTNQKLWWIRQIFKL